MESNTFDSLKTKNRMYDTKYLYVKHEGSNVMVWSCFLLSGVEPLVRIDGNMDQFMYADTFMIAHEC